MKKESANPPPPNIMDWIKIWGAALLRPTPAGYAAIFGSVQPHRATAMAWLVTGGVLAAILNVLTYTAPPEIVLMVTACALPVFGFVYVALTIFTARGGLWILAQMDHTAAFDRVAPFDRLFYTLAAINAPMSIISALVYLVPYGRFLSYALSIYWIYLTILAFKTLLNLPWSKAAAASAVFILASLLAFVLGVGAAFLPAV